MKVGVDDFLLAHGEQAFKELLKTARPFIPGWTDKEAEFWFHLQDITKETPRTETLKRLQALVPVLARMDNLEFAGLLEELKDRLGLSGQMVAALRRDIKEAREKLKKAPSDQADKPALSIDEEIKALRLLAAPLLQCPNVLEKVAEVLRCCGLAGQEKEAKIIYLAVTSRVMKLKVLVNVAVKGPSSAGKSFLVEIVLELFPPSAFYALTAMSEKALAYSQEPLSHRHHVIYEAAGLSSEFAQYLIRSMLSEGRVVYETVEKVNGCMVPKRIEREGPTGFITTTTRAGLHPENETSLLSLEVDDTPEQTKAVLLAHAKEEEPRNVDLNPFKALQRLLELKPPQVVVPFAEDLARGCDPTAVRLRRDFKSVLSLIKAHAILHAHHRGKDAQGRVIASLEDYAAVYDLVADLVSYGTGQKVPEKMRETIEPVRHLEAGNSDGVSYTAIGKQLGIDESAARRRVRTAILKGFLENRETKPRCAAKIVTSEPLPDAKEVLPHPKSLSNIHPETTADMPTDDDSLGKEESYDRQIDKPTGCRPPTAPPRGQGVEEPRGQAVGKGSANQGADHNQPESHHIWLESAGRHKSQKEGNDERLENKGQELAEDADPWWQEIRV